MPSPRDREQAQAAADRFVANAGSGDDAANDELVRELDPRPAPEGRS